jgi:aerobic carbon-monoxide dehydrogenase large subunit
VTHSEIARIAYERPQGLPPGMDPGLEASGGYRPPPMIYSNACHACVVEVNAHTGQVQILDYVVSEDCGVMIHPGIVEGQISGGIVQGIGGVLFERSPFDDRGNPLAVTFLDYLIPFSTDVPTIRFGHIETPGPTPGNHKGLGEGGAIGSCPAVWNAVRDALRPFGAEPPQQYLDPPTLLEIMHTRGKEAGRASVTETAASVTETAWSSPAATPSPESSRS